MSFEEQRQYWHGREETREGNEEEEGGWKRNAGRGGGGKAAISVIRRPALARY